MIQDYTTQFRAAVKRLRAVYDDGESAAIARLLLEEITGMTYSAGLVRSVPLPPDQSAWIEAALHRLEKGEPLQYVLGYADFRGMRFVVSPAVLIPRPETEELVEWMLDDLRHTPRGRFLDIGSGSGCIPVSFGKMLKGWEVSALDISYEALEVLQKNAAALGVPVKVLCADFLDERSWPALGQFDIICSNPPYIPQSDAAGMHANVKDFEPHLALFVPDVDPLLFYRMIARFGMSHAHSGAFVYCELHKDHAQETAALFRAAGYRDVRIRVDLHGAERMLRATRP